jgi:hypothetical protein
LIQYIRDNTNIAEKKSEKDLKTVIVEFLVKTDGSVANVTTQKNSDEKLLKEAISLIEKSGKWYPGIQNFRLVQAIKKQAIPLPK